MIDEPNRVTIDLSALAYNLRQIRMLIGQSARIMGVVKSDAYGHGLLPVSQTLEKSRIDCLGVAHLNEAVELRDLGVRLPIAVLCGIRTKEECREVIEKDLIPIIFDLETAKILDQESAKKKKKTAIHLKVDTGMGRLGIAWDEAGAFVREIMSLKNLKLDALLSHLSSADEDSAEITRIQAENFRHAIETARYMGLELPLNSLANSAGIMGHPYTNFEMVRPGIMLYGGLPNPEFKSKVDLKPVMHFMGRVLQIRNFRDHTPISYGRRYFTNGPRRIAVLSAGYGDGIPRGISNRGMVLVNGKRAPIVGTICMNLTICDITGLRDVKPGDSTLFLGSQGEETITGDDMAKWAGTISYEVFCSIGRGNKREYIA